MTGRVERLREACEAARSAGAQVGFVPTMGALHEGHLSLVRRARAECGLVVLSIFVNPLQFAPGEDLAEYPRDLDRDASIAERVAADLIFAPEAKVMYPVGRPETTVDPGVAGDAYEGASRPGHFRGVCTVVAKLLNMVGRCRMYLGEKDAQQLFLVRRMVAELDISAEVVACPTVREPDGLAMSSRNAYLNPEERRAATCLHRALVRASEVVAHGERDPNVVRAEMARIIGAEPLARIDYVAVVDERAFAPVEEIEGPSQAVVAARVGSTRLIDAMRLPHP